MSEAKHAPTPWRVGNLVGSYGYSRIPYRNIWSGFNEGAHCAAHVSGIETKDVDANAEFIVRACNSHEALVKALEKAEKMRNWFMHTTPEWNRDTEKAINEFDAALALARGER